MPKLDNMPTVEDIAMVCHETNRAYCKTIGDDSQPTWENAPDWQKESARKGVRFHLTAIENGQKPSPSASHEAWMTEKANDGWKYGPVKDPAKKEHPCFVQYINLPAEQRLKDYLFCAIVEAFAEAK